jgi:Protein of unknown function (DUF2934)
MAKPKIMETPAVVQKPKPPGNLPIPEEIALRAYYIYLQRAGAPGDEIADWVQAERELIRELAEDSSKTKRKASVKSIAA